LRVDQMKWFSDLYWKYPKIKGFVLFCEKDKIIDKSGIGLI
jgi:hypothetical protein